MNDRFDSLPPAARAWVWRGGSSPLDLALETLPLPQPGPGEVLVRNEVVGLNPVDWKVLGGELVDWQPGKVPGVDGCGIVAAIGEGVDPSWLDRRVAYHQDLQRPGSFAEYVPVAARVLLPVPDGLAPEIAASLPCPALTAWQALRKLPTRPGQALLVSGAGGAVGHYLVQLASARDWRVTTMSHPRHWERLRGFGASECLAGPLPAGQAWTGGARFAAAIDSIDADHAARLAPALRANGHLVCIQGRVPHWPNPPFGRALSLHEAALGALHRHGDEQDWADLTAAGARLLYDLARGRLQPEPLVLRDFGELAQLLDELRRRNFSGKPLLRVA